MLRIALRLNMIDFGESSMECLTRTVGKRVIINWENNLSGMNMIN